VDGVFASFPKVIPSLVRIRRHQLSGAEIASRLEDYLRTPSALMDCPGRIALFGHCLGSGDPTLRFFRWDAAMTGNLWTAPRRSSREIFAPSGASNYLFAVRSAGTSGITYLQEEPST
jgi:hypothetical protein